MSFFIIIPARFGSTRLPGKPLLKIGSRTMIQHVYQNCLDSGAESVIVATDNLRIKTEVESFGGKVCLTDSSLVSGSDRVASAVEHLGFDAEDIIVNVQGDEPFLSAEVIRQVGVQVENERKFVATVSKQLSPKTPNDENVVKVVTNCDGLALYFSRASIPYFTQDNDNYTKSLKKHIGIYGYTVEQLLKFVGLERPEIEREERLEQLRFLYHGIQIKVLEAKGEVGIGVDTKEDLEKAKNYLAR